MTGLSPDAFEWARSKTKLSRWSRIERFALRTLPLLILSVIFATALHAHLNDDPNKSDAAHNLASAYNLAYYGVYSHERDDDPIPTNYREPFPPLITALQIKLNPELSSDLTFDEMNSGKPVTILKIQNLYWAFFCLLGVMTACFLAVRNQWIAAIVAFAAICLTYKYFLDDKSILNRMMTEIQAGTLLVWSSVFLMLALRRLRWAWFLLAGISLGLLTLTKAAFLYVSFGVVAALLTAYMLWPAPAVGRIRMGVLIAVLAVGLGGTLAPWVVRNYVVLGETSIADRGPRLLHARMYRATQMTDLEYVGAYYAYSPRWLQPIVGSMLGFQRSDLRAGGKLERVNRRSHDETDLVAEKAGRPQDAVSIYRTVRAERKRLQNEFYDEGLRGDDIEVALEQELKNQTAEMFRENPWGYFRSIPLYLWRGSTFAGVPIMIFAAIGLLWRRPAIIGLTLAPAGGIALLGLATHFIPRYNQPFEASIVIVSCVSVGWVVSGMVAAATREQLHDVSNAHGGDVGRFGAAE